MSRHILVVFIERQVSITLLASQSLLQLIAGEITQSTDTNHLVENLQVGKVGGVCKLRLTTISNSLHLYLIVLEVCLFQNHFRTVREFQFLIIEGLVLCLRKNLTSLNCCYIN